MSCHPFIALRSEIIEWSCNTKHMTHCFSAHDPVPLFFLHLMDVTIMEEYFPGVVLGRILKWIRRRILQRKLPPSRIIWMRSKNDWLISEEASNRFLLSLTLLYAFFFSHDCLCLLFMHSLEVGVCYFSCVLWYQFCEDFMPWWSWYGCFRIALLIVLGRVNSIVGGLERERFWQKNFILITSYPYLLHSSFLNIPWWSSSC